MHVHACARVACACADTWLIKPDTRRQHIHTSKPRAGVYTLAECVRACVCVRVRAWWAYAHCMPLFRWPTGGLNPKHCMPLFRWPTGGLNPKHCMPLFRWPTGGLTLNTVCHWNTSKVADCMRTLAACAVADGVRPCPLRSPPQSQSREGTVVTLGLLCLADCDVAGKQLG